MEPSWSPMEPPEHLPYCVAPFRGTPVGRAQDLLQKRGSECGHKVVVLDTSNRAILAADLDVRSGAQTMA